MRSYEIRNADQYSGAVPDGEAVRDSGIQVLRRAAAALDEIAAAPGQLRLVDLGERLGLAKSTTRRLLFGLVEVGLAVVDERGRFAVGDRLRDWTANGAQLATLFRPTIEAVADETGETVDLSVRRGSYMYFIDQIESGHRLRAVSAVGSRFPLATTANGKAALALSGEVADPPDGIAFDRDQHTEGISAAGIAGRLSAGHVVAISVPAPTERFRANEAVIVAALKRAAASSVWRR